MAGRGQLTTPTDRMDMPTDRKPGMLAEAFWEGVSESQLCMAKMTDVHPIILLRVKIYFRGTERLVLWNLESDSALAAVNPRARVEA